MDTLFGKTTIQQVAPKIRKHIEIVASSNPRFNAMARGTQSSIVRVLSERYTKVGVTLVDNMPNLNALVAKKPDLVLLAVKPVLLNTAVNSKDSPKVWLSDHLKKNGINFTGSDTEALTYEFEKQIAKQRIIDAGLNSAAFFIAKASQPTLTHNLTFPLFVKPTNRGGSTGVDEMSVVYNQEELAAKVAALYKDHASDALVEEYLPGREFSVAVMRHLGSDELTAMPIEIVSPADAKGNRFLREGVKKSSENILAVTDPELKKALQTLAINSFKALGARDYGRIDMRLNAAGEPYFIEANLLPGLSDRGYMLRCCMLNGHMSSHKEMILSIIALAFERENTSASAAS